MFFKKRARGLGGERVINKRGRGMREVG